MSGYEIQARAVDLADELNALLGYDAESEVGGVVHVGTDGEGSPEELPEVVLSERAAVEVIRRLKEQGFAKPIVPQPLIPAWLEEQKGLCLCGHPRFAHGCADLHCHSTDDKSVPVATYCACPCFSPRDGRPVQSFAMEWRKR